MEYNKTERSYKKAAATAAVYVMIITALYLLTRLRYESGQRQFSLKAYLISAVLVIGTGYFHSRKKGKQPAGEYLGTLLYGGGGEKKRIAYLDYLRVLATALVIGVHIMEPAYQTIQSQGGSWMGMAVVTSIFHSSNLLFLMISGALILNGKEEPVWTFYKKRFLKVAAPCFAYYCFYCFYFYGTSAFAPDQWLKLVGSFTANNTGITPHFWLVHVILACYLAAPFFSIMVKHMTEEQLTALAAVIVILHFVYTYGPFGQINFVLTTFLASWESVFILGYFLTTRTAMKYYRLVLGAAAVSVAAIFLGVWKAADFSALLYNNAPPVIFIAAAVFLFFRKHGETLFAVSGKALQAAGRYSFSILMIHWFILFEIVEKILGINGLSFGVFGGVIIGCAAVFLLSAVFSFIYDNTVVLCLNGFLDRISETLRKCKDFK